MLLSRSWGNPNIDWLPLTVLTPFLQFFLLIWGKWVIYPGSLCGYHLLLARRAVTSVLKLSESGTYCTFGTRKRYFFLIQLYQQLPRYLLGKTWYVSPVKSNINFSFNDVVHKHEIKKYKQLYIFLLYCKKVPNQIKNIYTIVCKVVLWLKIKMKISYFHSKNNT